MITLRRILVTAFVAALAGFGVFAALLGRRPRSRIARRAEGLVPGSAPVPVSRSGGGRGLAVVLVCLLVLLGSAGVVYESRDALFAGGPRKPDGSSNPLAALSPQDAGSALPKARPDGMATGSVRTSQTDEPVALKLPHRPASTAPGFDVVRVEPNGDAVIAGQAAPNSTVELLVDGKPVGSARANADGRFTFMPPTLPAGNSEIGLRATDAKGDVGRSQANVSVVIAPSRDTKPLVAVTSPGKPTLVLSQPDQPETTRPGPGSARGRQALRDDGDASARHDGQSTAGDGPNVVGPPQGSNARGTTTTGTRAGTDGPDAQEPNRALAKTSAASPDPKDAPRPTDVPMAASTPPQVVAIDAQGGGKLFVTARAPAGADLRLYLNDTLIAPATVGRDGTVTFAIGHGVRPGDYKVRLDLVDPATGKVRDRAEVPFSAPGAGHDAGVEYAAGPTASGGAVPGNDVARREPPFDPADPPQPSSTASLAANVPPGSATGSSEVTIPGIETARIERGDSLWRISRRVYGEGERYTLIYDANQDQIRDPDLIYPGQVLVLPNRETSGSEQVGK